MVKPSTISPESVKADEGLKKEKAILASAPTAVVVPEEVVTSPTAPPVPRRRPCCTPLRCCVTGTFVLLLIAGIAIGGYQLARHRHGQKFFRCGVDYKDPPRHDGHRGSSSSEEWHEMEEELEIDPEAQFERIEQPANNVCERITIMHDYNIHLSAYRLWTSGKCYIKELNMTTSLRPEEFWNKLQDAEFFNQHFQTLVETYRVVLPPLMDFRNLGMYIPLLCAGSDTYWLEKVQDDQFEELWQLAEEIMEQIDEGLDDMWDEAGERTRRDVVEKVDEVVNWTGKKWINMKVLGPSVTKALEKAGKLPISGK